MLPPARRRVGLDVIDVVLTCLLSFLMPTKWKELSQRSNTFFCKTSNSSSGEGDLYPSLTDLTSPARVHLFSFPPPPEGATSNSSSQFASFSIIPHPCSNRSSTARSPLVARSCGGGDFESEEELEGGEREVFGIESVY